MTAPRRLTYAYLGDDAQLLVGAVMGPTTLGEPLWVHGFEHDAEKTRTTLLLDYRPPVPEGRLP